MNTRDVMLYVDGSKNSFRCRCGCNVFRQIEGDNDDRLYYQCNGCDEYYIGEKDKTTSKHIEENKEQ